MANIFNDKHLHLETSLKIMSTMCYNWSNLRSIFSTQFRLPVTSTQSDVQSNPSQQFFRYVRDDIMSKVISILTDRISKITSILRSCSPHVGKLQQYWLIARACYVTPSICNSNSIAFWSQNRYFIKNTFLEFFTIRWTRKENFLVSMQDYAIACYPENVLGENIRVSALPSPSRKLSQRTLWITCPTGT